MKPDNQDRTQEQDRWLETEQEKTFTKTTATHKEEVGLCRDIVLYIYYV